jgi:hypothetical protein
MIRLNIGKFREIAHKLTATAIRAQRPRGILSALRLRRDNIVKDCRERPMREVNAMSRTGTWQGWRELILPM